MSEFHNPFHFVPVEKIAPAELMPREELRPPDVAPQKRQHPHVTHDRYLDQTVSDAVYSGIVRCRLTTRTPTVLGSLRTDATERQPASVLPFMVPGNGTARAMEPALPETSLRGMISSLYEALTNSALRVLCDEEYLVRMDQDEKRSSRSSSWKRKAGTAWDWFHAVDPNLLPMHGKRTQVTLAEQVFGFADAGTDGREPGEESPRKDPTETPPVAALAGRLRFSTGRWVSVGGNKIEFAWEKEAVTLPILGSPKPPSPRLYFRRKSPAAGVGKKELPRVIQKNGDIQPQGRKMYLIHEGKLAGNTKLDVYKTKSGENLKQKTRVKPLRHGQTFEFTIRFDNLSARELGLLLITLKPNAGFLHRLGMGKPLGMGVVELQPQSVELVDRKRRYAKDDLFDDRVHATWTPGDKDWTEIVTAARKSIDANRLAVIELLGDPKSTKGHTVAYPFVDGAEGSEEKLFEWHMQNESGRAGQPQSLPPIAEKLPLLKTVPPPRRGVR